MIHGFSPAVIAAAEKPLVEAAEASRGPDALMRGAAYALYWHTHRLLSGKIPEVTGEDFRSVPISHRRILVLVGSGNNGGDGLYAAADLVRRGYPVVVLPVGENLHSRGQAVARSAGVRFWSPVTCAGLQPRDSLDSDRFVTSSPCYSAAGAALAVAQWQAVCLIDAITGIGAQPPLREPARSLLRELNRLVLGGENRPWIVACDNPSGLDLEQGAAPEYTQEVLRADLTVTMGAPKSGLLLGPASAYAGRIEIHPIGLPLETMESKVSLIEAADAALLWPWPESHSHKYSRGVLSVLAGTAKYPGAGVLVTAAARAAGSAFIRYLGEAAVQAVVLEAACEAVLVPGRSQALVLGPGFDATESGHRHQLVKTWETRGAGTPVILDAGALPLVKAEITADEYCLLTPHVKEAAALAKRLGYQVTSAEIEADPGRWAQQLAAATRATVLLKGNTTTIASPTGHLLSMNHGTAALATAGSGDVLAGIIGHLLASWSALADLSSTDIAHAAGVGAWVHAAAGRVAARQINPTPAASDLVKALPQVLRELCPTTISA